MTSNAREKIQEWCDKFAPGLTINPIPDEAEVEGPLGELIPFGLQYRVRMPDGRIFPSHISGPGTTTCITDGENILVVNDVRVEHKNRVMLKLPGGFAGRNQDVARELVKIYELLGTGITAHVVDLREGGALLSFYNKLLIREGGFNFLLRGGQRAEFIFRPVPWPNIRITSVCCVVEVERGSLEIFPPFEKEQPGCSRMNWRGAACALDKGLFGDPNTVHFLERAIMNRRGHSWKKLVMS